MSEDIDPKKVELKAIEEKLRRIGHRLGRIDHHLLNVIAHRVGAGSLSEAVAAAKTEKMLLLGEKGTPGLKRKKVEAERLAQAQAWAEMASLDPDCARAILYAIISESCRTQVDYLHDHSNDDPTNQSGGKYLRDQLLALTAAVCRTYDDRYAGNFLGTKTYLDFETGELGRLVAGLKDHNLALDLGCATGQRSFLLADSFECVIGYDVSPDMIGVANEKAQSEKYKDKNISFEVVDLEKGVPQKDNSVSLVLMSLGTGSDIKKFSKLLAEIHRVLRPGGAFLLSFYNADSLLSKLGFLPWPTSLAAMIEPERNCLEVRVGNKVFYIHAKPYSKVELEKLFAKQGLGIDQYLTHPVFSSVMPEDLFSDHFFDGYEPLGKEQSAVAAQLNVVAKKDALSAVAKLDEHLARSSGQNLGAYIIVTGTVE